MSSLRPCRAGRSERGREASCGAVARGLRAFPPWVLLGLLLGLAVAAGSGGGLARADQAASPAAVAPWSLDAEGGFQQAGGGSDRVKFSEYRDIGDPVALPLLDLRVRSWDVDFRLGATDAAEHDAVYRFSATRPGVFGVRLGWDDQPHELADVAQTLHRIVGGNELVISNSIQRALQAAPFLLEKFLKKNTHEVQLRTERKTRRGDVSFSPATGLVLYLKAEEEDRSGLAARSVSTNFLNGADVTEWATPIAYKTWRTNAGADYALGPLQLGLSASATKFRDDVGDRLLVDNPLRATDGQGGAFGNRSASRFLVSTPPDNEAREIALHAAVTLPHELRFTAGFGTGNVDAKTDMLPYTSNTVLAADFFFPKLPATTFDGKITTTRYDAALTGNPLRQLGFKVFARGYKYDNQTPLYAFPAYIDADTRFASVPRVALPYGWKRDGGGADLKLRASSALFFTAGFEREIVQRNFREVDRTAEDTYKGGLGWQALTWLSLRASMARADRAADSYDPNAYLQSYPNGVPGSAASFGLLRRFDEADRKRREVAFTVLVAASDGFQFDISSRQRTDQYRKSEYGLTDDATRNASFGLSFIPFSPCTTHAEIDKEFFSRRVNARFRPLLSGQAFDTSVNDWSDEISEKVHTLSLGLMCREEEGKWEFDMMTLSSTDRQNDDAAFAPHAFLDPGFQAHARTFPVTKRKTKHTDARAKFRLSSAADIIMRVVFEKLDEGDVTQDLMVPAMGNVDAPSFESAYLGARTRGYSARIVSVMLGAHW